MTGSRLVALLDQATPGPWEALHDNGTVWAHGYCIAADEFHNAKDGDARLIALAPDMARLLVDDRPVVEWAASVACLEPNEDGVSVCGGTCATCVARALLARFAALDEKAGGA